MAVVPASGTQTAFLTINSMDRYASLDISRDPAQQTSATDITYTIPGLEKVKSIQLINYTAQVSPGLASASPATYLNVINVIYNGVTKLLVLPYDSVTNTNNSMFYTLPVFLRDSTVNFFLAPFNTPNNGVGFGTYATAPGGTSLAYATWRSNVATLGFSRVTTYNGVDISGKTQLFDILNLGYQTVSGVGVSQVSAIGQWASATLPYYPNVYNTGIFPFLTLSSPDLDPLYPDLSTSATLSSLGTIIQRNSSSSFAPPNYSNIVSSGSGNDLKSYRTKGKNTLRIRMGDTNGNPLPPSVTIPAVMRYVSQSIALSSTLVGSGTTAVITVAGTPALTLSGIVAGDSIAVYCATASATALNGVFTVTGVTSNTVTISFGTQTTFTGTATSITIAGPVNAGGVTSAGGIGEYILTFAVDYGTNVPVITSPILS